MRKIKNFSNLSEVNFNMDKTIKGVAKKRKQVVYGARSIEAQNNLFARDTKDWDVFDKNPKQVAKMVEKILDKQMKANYFYSEEALHKGTWKVKGIGNDRIRGSEDDESIADYSKLEKGVPFVVKNGVRYRKLREEIMAKKKSVADPEFEFRHKKDKDDLNRIKGYLKVQRLLK